MILSVHIGLLTATSLRPFGSSSIAVATHDAPTSAPSPATSRHLPAPNSSGTTLALKYVHNASVEVIAGPPSTSLAVLSLTSSLDADGANHAVFNIAVEGIETARSLRDNMLQAAEAMLLRLEDALSEANAEASMPTVLMYDVGEGGGPDTRAAVVSALRRLNCAVVFTESWSAAVEMLQGGEGGAHFAAFLCDTTPEGGWGRIEAGGERGTSGWDITRVLRSHAADDAEAAAIEGGGRGEANAVGARAYRRKGRCGTRVPVVGIGTMGADETARDPRADSVPVSSVICHCEESGMMGYIQKPLTAAKLRAALAGIVPGVESRVGDDDEDLEEEEHLDEALEDWSARGGWVAKLAMVPFRISRYALKSLRSCLPLWMVHLVGNAFGVHFKNR